jgi:hypothetical protein
LLENTPDQRTQKVPKIQNLPGSTTDLGQSQTDSPDLTLIAQAILADELQLRVTIVIGQSSFTIDLNRGKLLFSGR